MGPGDRRWVVDLGVGGGDRAKGTLEQQNPSHACP